MRVKSLGEDCSASPVTIEGYNIVFDDDISSGADDAVVAMGMAFASIPVSPKDDISVLKEAIGTKNNIPYLQNKAQELGLNTNLLNLYEETKSFYLLSALSTLPYTMLHSHQRLKDDVLREFAILSKKLANAMYDYLCLACFAEVGHFALRADNLPQDWLMTLGSTKLKRVDSFASNYKYEQYLFQNVQGFVCKRTQGLYVKKGDTVVKFPFPARTKDFSRDLASVFATDCDPKAFLPVCANLFRDYVWRSGYGGKKWEAIARKAMRYGEVKDELFVDEVTDLCHNNGTVWNKGFVFSSPGSEYRHFLDVKRQRNILETIGNHRCPQYVALMFERARNLQLIKGGYTTDSISSYAPKTYKSVEWGCEKFERIVDRVPNTKILSNKESE